MTVTGDVVIGLRFVQWMFQWLMPSRRVAVLQRREALKAEIRKNLKKPDGDASPEVVLVRLDKESRYPETDSRLIGFTASYWAKLEFKDVRDHDIEFFWRCVTVAIKGSTARVVSPEDPRAITVFVVGRFPIDRIAHIDWGADPAYHAPRFYGLYWRKLFREQVLYQERGDYCLELSGIKYKPDKARAWTRLRSSLQQRRYERRLRKQDSL